MSHHFDFAFFFRWKSGFKIVVPKSVVLWRNTRTQWSKTRWTLAACRLVIPSTTITTTWVPIPVTQPMPWWIPTMPLQQPFQAIHWPQPCCPQVHRWPSVVTSSMNSEWKESSAKGISLFFFPHPRTAKQKYLLDLNSGWLDLLLNCEGWKKTVENYFITHFQIS